MNTLHILEKQILGAHKGDVMECNVEAGKYREICDCCGQLKTSCMQFFEHYDRYNHIIDVCASCRAKYIEEVDE